jgi:hypothetical protein
LPPTFGLSEADAAARLDLPIDAYERMAKLVKHKPVEKPE